MGRDADVMELKRAGGLAAARKKAIVTSLRGSSVRSVCWKVFLEVLPSDSVDEWDAHIAKERAGYEADLKRLWVDPHKEQKGADLSVDNPLSQAQDSSWNVFFKNQELQTEIQKDLERLYSDHEYFTAENTQKMLMRILFVWSTLHPKTSYRQGMHELLAPLVWVLHNDAMHPPEGGGAHSCPVMNVMDSRFVESDSYLLFTKLMIAMEPLFEVRKRVRGEPPPSEADMLPLQRKCHRVFGSLLKSRDVQLFKHLTALEIEPQLFLLRWVRCLFAREFHLDDVMVLWDAVFADSPSLVLVDYICVAMLKFVRTDLLGKDQSLCLRRLMKYPPVEDVHRFIVAASQVRNPRQAAPAMSPRRPAAPASPAKSSARNPGGMVSQGPAGGGGGQRQTMKDRLHAKLPQRISNRPGVAAAVVDGVAAMSVDQMHVMRFREGNKRLAKQMAGLIRVLEHSCAEPESFDQDWTLLAIAQLKQIKDVLMGSIPIDSLEHMVPIVLPKDEEEQGGGGAGNTNAEANAGEDQTTVTPHEAVEEAEREVASEAVATGGDDTEQSADGGEGEEEDDELVVPIEGLSAGAASGRRRSGAVMMAEPEVEAAKGSGGAAEVPPSEAAARSGPSVVVPPHESPTYESPAYEQPDIAPEKQLLMEHMDEKQAVAAAALAALTALDDTPKPKVVAPAPDVADLAAALNGGGKANGSSPAALESSGLLGLFDQSTTESFMPSSGRKSPMKLEKGSLFGEKKSGKASLFGSVDEDDDPSALFGGIGAVSPKAAAPKPKPGFGGGDGGSGEVVDADAGKKSSKAKSAGLFSATPVSDDLFGPSPDDDAAKKKPLFDLFE